MSNATDNTTGASEKGVVVLGKYVDALYLSVRGKPKDGVLEALARKKPSSPQPQFFGEQTALIDVPGIPGGPLNVLSQSRGQYEFSIHNEDLYLELTRSANLPALIIQFRSHLLYEQDFHGLQEIVDTLASFFLESGFSTLVSRFDLALDFQAEGWQLGHINEADIITRARTSQIYRQRSQTQTLTIGQPKRGFQVQVYNKAQEIEQSGKAWMIDVWRESGRYNESLAVWRVEYRFQRERLRNHGIDTIADLRRSMGDLVRSVVGDEGISPWIRFASPNTRGRKQDRRPAARWWEEIRGASIEELPTSGLSIENPQRETNLKQDLAMFFAYLERIVAQWVMSENLHLHEASLDELMDRLKTLYRKHLDSKGLDLPETIRARMRKINRTSYF